MRTSANEMRYREAVCTDTEITTRSLAVRADTVDDETRSVEAVLSSEQPVQVFDFQRFEIIEEVLIARGARLPSQLVLLDTHSRESFESIMGSIRNLRVEGSQVVGRLFISADEELGPDSRHLQRGLDAWSLIRKGHLTDVSLGYRADEFIDIKPGTTEVVDGRSFTARELTLRISKIWTPREGSLVPIGADDAAKLRQEAGRRREAKEFKTMNEQLREYLESIGLREDTDEKGALAFLDRLKGGQREKADELAGKIQADPVPAPAKRADAPEAKRATPVTPPEPVDVGALVAESTRAERVRVRELRAAAGDDIPEEMLNRAIDEDWSVKDAAPVFLEHMRKSRVESVGAGPGIICRDHNRDCTQRAVADALAMRCGIDLVDRNATDQDRAEQAKRSEQAAPWAGYSLVEMCREGLRIAGISIPHSREDMIRAAVSTGSMTNIFGNTVGKKLLSAYDETPDTTRPWTTEVPLADFKTVQRPFLGKTGVLEKLPRGSTAKHATRSDTAEEYKIASYAKQFVVDRADIIDDDLGALMTMPAELGAAAANLRPDLVYSILFANAALGADGVALFHTVSHKNLDTTAALTADTLKAGLTAMAIQQQDGKNLGLFGKNILVPHTLKFTASVLIRSQQTIATGTTDLVFGDFNPLTDEGLGIIADSRLDNGVTDPSTGEVHAGQTVDWYLVASGGRHTIEVGVLAGTGGRPQIRSFILDQGQYGIGWDIIHDIGAKALDYRGFYRGEG